MRILYLTPGCFDKGGISRYNRYQIAALRETAGPDAVRVFSLLGPDANGFEEALSVSWSGAATLTRRSKLALVAQAIATSVHWKPTHIFATHVRMAGLGKICATLSRGAKLITNTYGHEVWSGLRPDARLGLRASDVVISDCHFTAEYLKAAEKIRENRLVVIWDCVDISRFEPGRPPSQTLEAYGVPDPDTHTNLMTLGRISRAAHHKGYSRLLQVFAQLKDIPELRLIFVGSGDLVEELRCEAHRLGIVERVVFTGSVHERDLVDIYRAAHVFSLVSDRGKGRGEGIPLTPLEAAACGVPIIVGNQDGSLEAVTDGESGFIVDPFDLNQHAAVIRRLVSDTNLRGRVASAAVLRARSEFSYRAFVGKHQELLERCSA